MTKKYTNGEVTVVWKPDLCIHSKRCWKELHDVFKPGEQPWVHMEGASTDRIVEQIGKCPSGALSHYMNDHSSNPGADEVTIDAETVIEAIKDGPLMIYGNVSIKDHNGQITRKANTTALCRCGASANKPYCDGTHRKIGFTTE